MITTWHIRLTAISLVAALLACCAAPSAAETQGPFVFEDGDRVVLLGGTFVEREVQQGYLETALTSALPELNLTFRNLGWSGDTVWADSRGIFDAPQVGYQRLLELVRELKPTVVFLAYGANESYAGEAGLASFIKQYEKLLDDLDKVSLEVQAPREFRYVFLTPHQLETPAPPLPDASRHNPTLGLYAAAIRELAERRGGRLVDLYDRTAQVTLTPENPAAESNTSVEAPRGFRKVKGVWKSLPLTDNGIHLSAYGSLRVARMIVHSLKLPKAEFLMQLDSDGNVESDLQATSSDFKSDGKAATFQMKLARLPEPPTPLFPGDVEYFMVAGGGLPMGSYALKIDGLKAAVNPTPIVGFPVRTGADYLQAEELRKAIIAKNLLFFHRWRPQNITYLTGFRKHEQGNNAVEIAQFDPLVAKAETEIVTLRQSVTRTYEIVPYEKDANE